MGGLSWDKGAWSPGWTEDTGGAQASGGGKWGKERHSWGVCIYAGWEDGWDGVGRH